MSPIAKTQAAVSLKEGRTVIETMTPEKALKILDKADKEKNRNISSIQVDLLARSIENGEWVLTHQGIAIDENGVLLDGQHRLWAIVASKRTVPIRVTYGVPRSTMAVVDRGRRRSIGGMLQVQGESYGASKAGIARILGAFVSSKGTSDIQFYRQTDREVLDTVDRYRDELNWFVGIKSRGNFSSAPLAAVMVYCRSVFPDVEQMYIDFMEGTNLEKGSPLHTLRQKIIFDTSDFFLRRHDKKILLMRYAFNAFAHAIRHEELYRVNDTLAGYEFFRKAKSQ